MTKMQENYKAMDSFGYETVEGIVAGVPSMADYDVYLDAGVPASEGPEGVASVVLDLGNGEKIDKQGALFTYIIEPMLWAGDKRWVTPVDGGKKSPPRPGGWCCRRLPRTSTGSLASFWPMPRHGMRL